MGEWVFENRSIDTVSRLTIEVSFQIDFPDIISFFWTISIGNGSFRYMEIYPVLTWYMFIIALVITERIEYIRVNRVNKTHMLITGSKVNNSRVHPDK